MGWYGFKHMLEARSGLAMDALHVHAGLLCLLLAALVLRRPVKSPLPWLAVLFAELLNEYYDLRIEIWPDRTVQWLESAKDVANTMLVPTVLLVASRFAPRLLVGAPQQPKPQALDG